MAEHTSVAEYYEQTVPALFARAVAEASADVAEQPELTTTYQITGEGGGTYGLRIAGGQIEVVPGGIDSSDMHTTLAEPDWRASVEQGMANPIEYYLRRKVDVLKGLRGIVRLDLARDGVAAYEGTIVFGDAETPEVTLRMKAEDYAAMMNGQLNGQMAFITGKLKFDGSLPLLMQLGALSA